MALAAPGSYLAHMPRTLPARPPAILLAGTLLASTLIAQAAVLVPQGADAEALAVLAATVRPSPRQLRWQQLGFTAFVHFGMNTFTDREWGEGSEDPRTFAPSDFDAEQWVATFAGAGMQGVVLTAKHHDGFCLWPTKTTDHCVRSSVWRDGKGDVVGEVAAACKRHGLAFGVYLSPWDRHQPSFGTKAYNQLFQAQLLELCSLYGPLFEVWFDGAHCPSDDPALFDWQAHFRLVRQLQPDAVIAITGPDVRWVGNEAGATRAQEWSVLPLDTADGGDFVDSRAAWQSLWRLRDRNQQQDLGSRAQLQAARRLCWWPAETDVSIRPGWFYHAAEDARVKGLDTLLDCWFGAVGGNAVLLLNVPADRRGRIADPDVAVLQDLGRYLDATFGRDLGEGGRRKTYAKAGEVYFQVPVTVDVFDLREDVAAHGQCVEGFRIDTFDGSAWHVLLHSGTIGLRRCLRTAPVTAVGFRYVIERSRGAPAVQHFGLHRRPELLAPPTIVRDRDGTVRIDASGEVHLTLDGSAPSASSPRYQGPFAMPRGGTVRAVLLPAAGSTALALCSGSASSAVFGLCSSGWKVVDCDSEQGGKEAAANAIDGDPSTIWHSRWSPDSPKPPHHLTIDLGQAVTLTGFVYTPRQDLSNGTIVDYEFLVSSDGVTFRSAAHGSFANIENHPVAQVVKFEQAATDVRIVRLVGLREVQGRAWSSCAELSVLVQ